MGDKVTIEIQGRVITFDSEDDKKLLAQIGNAEEAQRQTVYADARNLFTDASKVVVDEQTDGLGDELEGQTLVYDMSADKIVLVDSRLISIKQRLSKVASAWYKDMPSSEEGKSENGEGNKEE